MTLRRLFPPGADTTPAELASGLRLGDLAPPDRPYLVLNMVSTVDGKAAVGGRTAPISSPVDRELFHHLRTQADAVMAGAGTVRAEGYGRMVKTAELRAKRQHEGLEPDALAVVVSASLALDPGTPLFQEPEQRVVIATESDRELEGVAAAVDYERTGDDLQLLMQRLRSEHGVRSILCEGGPDPQLAPARGRPGGRALPLPVRQARRRRRRPDDRRGQAARGAGRDRAHVGLRGRGRPLFPLARRLDRV